jgi:hypothetical protein
VGKVLFSIVLVAAAFAGGAAINGPGLRWVQANVGLLSSSEEEASATTDKDKEKDQNPLAITSISMVESPSPRPLDPAPARPGAPDPATASANTNAPVPEPKAPAPLDLAALNLDEPVKPASSSAPEVASASTPRLEPPGAKEAAPATKPSEPAPAPAPSPPPPWSDMPGSAPAAAVAPRPYPHVNPENEPAPPSGSGAPPAPTGDWTEVRRKMRELGVARYGIEGEPGGKVRFHCLIPLAGRRAVGQQFEAEGNDEIQAAQAALRRVALWRATEGEPPARPAD